MQGRSKTQPIKRRVGRPAPEGWERVPDFAERNHFGINQCYAACARGEFEHIRVGKTILIRSDALERRAAAMAASR